MNEILKQRLVGALILVALGVIFWPIIFVEPESEQTPVQRGLPPGPQVSPEPIGAPDPAGLRASPPIAAQPPEASDPELPPEPLDEAVPSAREVENQEALEPAAGPSDGAAAIAEGPADEPGTRREAPQPLSLDADGVPVAWVLQVASVSNEEKAEELRTRLLAMDHKAYVEKVTSGGRALYRVYIGPKFEKEKLDALRDRIDAEFAVKSMVRRYVP